MRLSRVLLLVSAVAGVLSVVAALFTARQVSLQCGLVTLVTLIGYVIVRGHVAGPRVRWAIAAGVGLLAVAMAVRLFWVHEPAGGQYLEPFDGRAAMLDSWRRTIDQEQVFAVGQLLGLLCLAVGVLEMPRRRWPRRRMLTTILAALVLLFVVGADVADRFDDIPVWDMLGIAWPALLAALVAVGLVALAGWRDDRAWLLPAGAVLVAVAQIVAFDDLTGSWTTLWTLSDFGKTDSVFLVTGVRVGAPVGGSLEVSAAMKAAVALAGPVLLTIGALRAARKPRPVEPNP